MWRRYIKTDASFCILLYPLWRSQKLSVKVVVKAIGAVPEKDVGGVIDSLTDDEKDVLMKYLYRGLEESESCNALLKWHGVLTERAGNGCIMRALSETTRL
jgi:actin related protein 2/3 complex subunit 5